MKFKIEAIINSDSNAIKLNSLLCELFPDWEQINVSKIKD